MKVLYLINSVAGKSIENARAGRGHDSGLFGLLRLPKYGIQADLLELEQFVPGWLATFLRRHILTMHYAHLPLFPLFFRYDIVFTSTAYSSLILKAILHVKKFKWIILDFNTLGTIREAKTLKQRIYAWAVGKADGIVCISEAARDAMKIRFPHLSDRIIFLHEATDPEYFKPRESSANSANAGAVAQKDIILSVGRFGRDFTTVIEATKDLHVECRLATKIMPLAKYKALGIAMPQEIPPHVSVKTYSHAEMLQAYEEAKVAVVGIAQKDDYYDSVGTFAVDEAMSMGKAVIATHTKSVESYITDGVNGILVPHMDVAAMRAKIQELLSNNDLRRRLGIEARKFAVEYLGPERFAKDLAEYFKGLASRDR